MNLTDKEVQEFLVNVSKPYSYFTIYYYDEGHWWYTQCAEKDEAIEKYNALKKDGYKHVVVTEEKTTPQLVAR